MPASLSCPKCGAPAGAGTESTRCDYCGSALATVSCPSCFAAMFAGMQFCPHCGAKAERALVDDSGRSLECPGCQTEMRVIRVGTTPMHECPSCASNWLDTATFTDMCTNREERGAVARIFGSAKVAPPSVAAGAVRYLPCPLCKKLMNRTNFGRRSGVIIDVCKGHGTWFQASELRNVLAFIDSGGFERARAEDLRRMADEHRSLERAFTDSAKREHSMHISMPTDIGVSDASVIRRALEQLLF